MSAKKVDGGSREDDRGVRTLHQEKKRGKSAGLLNALGKKVGANRGEVEVNLDDTDMLALLPTAPLTSSFHPVFFSGGGVERRNVLDQSSAQFANVARSDENLLSGSGHLRSPAEVAALRLADIEVDDVRELQWEGHIVVCGCLRGIAQFIHPLREPHIKALRKIVVMVPFGELDDRTRPPTRLFAALRQFNEVYVLTYEPPMTRDDFRRAGVETAANVVILDLWSGKDGSEKRKDAEGIIMYRLLAGLKLVGSPLLSLESASSVNFITTRSYESEATQEGWYRNELYASGGVVLAENQDTILCQAFYMPEMLAMIKAFARGIVLQLNVTTLCPSAKGMLYRDFLCLVVSTTDLIPLGLYRTEKETITNKSGWSVSALAELVRNNTAAEFRKARFAGDLLGGGGDEGQRDHLRARHGKLKKTEGFEEDEAEVARRAEEDDDSDHREERKKKTSNDGTRQKGKSRLLGSFERRGGSSSRKKPPAPEEEREFKYVLTHPPWDCRLRETDRVYLLLSDTETWVRMRRRDESQDPHDVVKSATPAERKIIEEQILQRLKGQSEEKKKKMEEELKEIAKKEKEHRRHQEKRDHNRRFAPWRKRNAAQWDKQRAKVKASDADDDENTNSTEQTEMTTLHKVVDDTQLGCDSNRYNDDDENVII